ncbi:MAG: hypothetical protein ACR2GA_07045 [Chloroflexota bacterium]
MDDVTHDADQPPGRDPERDARILALRDGGATWAEIQHTFDLTRQQARYCYQRGKRVVRRAARRST